MKKIKKVFINTIFGISVLFSSLMFGVTRHGEGKLGPHGGFVRMPGEFHVEILPAEAKQLKVYLLDLQNREPLIIASSVRGTLKQNNKEFEFTCISDHDYFLCQLPQESNLDSGELHLRTVRREAVGRLAVYKLPLSLPDK